MRTKIFFISLLAVLCTACKNSKNTEIIEDIKNTPKYNILYKDSSIYIDWYLKNPESIIQYSYAKSPLQIFERNTQDNTLMLNDKVGIRIHDSYTISNNEETTTFNLTREASVLESSSISTNHIIIETRTVEPIEFIQPSTDECNCIPMCYYEDMQIEWNQDPNNTNGIVIVAEWNGITMDGQTGESAIANIDIVDDTGVAILNNDLFEGIPDEALVNLWLLRANIIGINYDGEMTLQELLEMTNGEPDLIQRYLEENPEFLTSLQTTVVGTGAIAVLPMYLIRNL